MRWICACFVLFAGLLQGQPEQPLSITLRHHLKTAPNAALIPVVLRGDVATIAAFVEAEAGRITYISGDRVHCQLLPQSFDVLYTCVGLAFVEFSSSRPHMLSDVMLINNNVVPVHQGAAPLPQAYTGADVIMGYVDSGIELNHPDFQFGDGSTRIIALWDQTQDEIFPFRVPEPYGYGQEWNAEDINAGITGHDDQAIFFGHGSTVTGVGSGNGFATGNFKGVAPDADVIVVSSDFDRPNWTVSVAEAVHFIFEKAAAIGKPAVVNLSLGDYYGSHDGLDAAALWIDEMLDESTGRVVVAAAGNSGNVGNYHLAYQVPTDDTVFTWFKYNAQALSTGAVFFEVWADAANFDSTQYAIGADATNPSFAFRGYSPWRNMSINLDQSIVDTLVYNGQQMGIIETYAALRGDQVLLQVAVTQPFSTSLRWRFATTGGGRFDCWSYAPFGTSEIFATNLPIVATYPPMANYRLPDNLKTMVDSWTCSDKVITVGNYNNQSSFTNYLGETTTYPVEAGSISLSSSRGPTRDFRAKPTIAATGDVTLSAGRLATLNSLINTEPFKVAEDGWHYVNGGTSLASPVVAGSAALFLERDPWASYQQILDAVIDNALADMFTGVLPGLQFGNGKLDVFAMMTNPFDVLSDRSAASHSGIDLYPNPASDQLYLRSITSSPVSAVVFDLSGRVVQQWHASQTSDNPSAIDISQLGAGYYLLSGNLSNGDQFQQKFVIVR